MIYLYIYPINNIYTIYKRLPDSIYLSEDFTVEEVLGNADVTNDYVILSGDVLEVLINAIDHQLNFIVSYLIFFYDPSGDIPDE